MNFIKGARIVHRSLFHVLISLLDSPRAGEPRQNGVVQDREIHPRHQPPQTHQTLEAVTDCGSYTQVHSASHQTSNPQRHYDDIRCRYFRAFRRTSDPPGVRIRSRWVVVGNADHLQCRLW